MLCGYDPAAAPSCPQSTDLRVARSFCSSCCLAPMARAKLQLLCQVLVALRDHSGELECGTWNLNVKCKCVSVCCAPLHVLWLLLAWLVILAALAPWHPSMIDVKCLIDVFEVSADRSKKRLGCCQAHAASSVGQRVERGVPVTRHCL